MERRRLAVERVLQGFTQQEVAEFLGVFKSAVCAWMQAFRRAGPEGLSAKPHPGKPRKLSPEQEQQVLTWFARSPTEFGFPNELWTAKRVALLIRREFKVKFHPRYICEWLAQRRTTVMVIWDRGNIHRGDMHRGEPINQLLARFPRLELHSLPPYAPDLNPVEHLWNHLKYGRFSNFAPHDVGQLHRIARKHLHYVCGSPSGLRSFVAASKLPFR